jgi:hypothetical protein
VKAGQILKDNIDALLRHRGKTRKQLAQFCLRRWDKTVESWISHIMRNPNRSFQIKYLDRMAEFLGVEPYQLLQPGITAWTERRSGKDRRRGTDRRLDTAERLQIAIGTEKMRVAAALVTKRKER